MEDELGSRRRVGEGGVKGSFVEVGAPLRLRGGGLSWVAMMEVGVRVASCGHAVDDSEHALVTTSPSTSRTCFRSTPAGSDFGR